METPGGHDGYRNLLLFAAVDERLGVNARPAKFSESHRSSVNHDGQLNTYLRP